MMTREVPGVSVSLGLVVPVALATAAIFLFLGRLALRAQRQPPVLSLLGQVGRTRPARAVDPPVLIDLPGELWSARCRAPIPSGRMVRVVDRRGLTLVVEPADDPTSTGDAT
jgi:membrane-bound ClpP family serine protease